MCNWCTNKITIYGNNIKELISKHFKVNEYGDKEFDFETIIKMPEELSIERSTTSADGFKLYLAKINPMITNLGKKNDKLSLKDFISYLFRNYDVRQLSNVDKYVLKQNEVKELKEKYKNNIEDVIKLGEKVYNNRLKYGCDDWYDWRIKYWGTKWNSSNTFISDDYSEILFDSAWTPAIPVIKELARLYPSLSIIHEWAEEQTGWYSGKYTYRNGELFEAIDYDEFSKEAYELSFELWGNDEQYKYDPKLDNYVYIDD